MSRIVFVNSVCYGSTGNICKKLYELAEKEGHECCIAYARGSEPEGYNSVRIGTCFDVYFHAAKARIFDTSGWESKHATKQFIKWLDDYKPDIIHMHNLHGYYLNLEIFFDYLKKNTKIKKIWTLHDCWSFTGHCAHFMYEKCEKWKTGCKTCQYINEYPKAILDNSEFNYRNKQKLYTAIANMILVTPSDWLKKQVGFSFLNKYPCVVINNGIDTSIFKQIKTEVNEKIVLGVASVWTKKKGLEEFVKLAERIDDSYQIVLIGLNKKQIKALPENIKGIERTENIEELVEWYNKAYVFFNPTFEETYPTVNIEAQACGTFVAAYDAGGTKETISGNNGIIVNSVDELIDYLKSTTINKLETNSNKYNWKLCFDMYLDLYRED